MRPKVSIIIRTFNEARYLAHTLAKIKQQTYYDFEIINVDSGSDDGTLDILDRFGVNTLHISPDDFSYGRSLNTGIEQAEGDIIVMLSAHAVPVCKFWLERLVTPFTDARVAATFGGQIPHPSANPFEVAQTRMLFPQESALICEPNREIVLSNTNGALRKSLWEKEKFSETAPFAEDQIWARCFLSQRFYIYYVSDAKVYHSHNDSIKTTFQRAIDAELAIRDETPLYLAPNLKVRLRALHRNIVSDIHRVANGKLSINWLSHIFGIHIARQVGIYLGRRRCRSVS